jgi:hypothetical protein
MSQHLHDGVTVRLFGTAQGVSVAKIRTRCSEAGLGWTTGGYPQVNVLASRQDAHGRRQLSVLDVPIAMRHLPTIPLRELLEFIGLPLPAPAAEEGAVQNLVRAAFAGQPSALGF